MLLAPPARAPIRETAAFDFEGAILATPEGGTLRLPAGNFYLARPLVLNRSITLVGQGAGLTSLEGEIREFLLRLVGGGPFALIDMTLKHLGPQPGRVVWVDGAVAEFERCLISGGKWVEDRVLGAGVHFTQSASGSLNLCELTDNDVGILLEDRCNVRLESNRCISNRLDGIRCNDQSRGQSIQNECSHNGGSGISLTGESALELTANRCSQNGSHGIAYAENSHGLCHSNDCDYNGHHGISVGDHADPRLENNQCNENQFCGLDFWGSTRATARNNRSNANIFHGLQVEDQARPSLLANHCSENRASGLAFFGDAAGTVSGHDLSRNDSYGIQVGDRAQPWIDDNSCRHNQLSGLAYFGEASGLARQNRCSHNGYHGLQVSDQARPLLEGNRSEHNQLSGIACFGESQPAVRGNSAFFNEQSGLFVGDSAEPFLDHNECVENSKIGLAYSGNAGGVAQKNRCEGNLQYGIHIGPSASPILHDNLCRNNPASDMVCLANTAVTVAAGSTRQVHNPLEAGFALTLETGEGQSVRIQLPFEPKANERKILETMARYTKLSEAQLAKATSTRRIGGLMESLIEKLQGAGSACLVREGDGPEGAIYAFRRT